MLSALFATVFAWQTAAQPATKTCPDHSVVLQSDTCLVYPDHRKLYSTPKSEPIQAPASVAPSDAVAAYVRQSLRVTRYNRADADLNGDGRNEAFVYVTDQGSCGSGGCTLVILSPQGKGYRVLLRSTVTQLPINLLPTTTRGWRDVGVTVAGGGITRPYMARLRFDGHHYPSNPTIPPAVPLKRKSGKVLIGT